MDTNEREAVAIFIRDRFHAMMARMDQRFSAMHDRFDRLESRFDKIESQLDRVICRLDSAGFGEAD